MIKKILKSIVTPDRLAGYAADGIQRGLNGTADSTAVTVAKYATMANELSELARNTSAMLTDGRIDELEKEQIKNLLKPLFEKVWELI